MNELKSIKIKIIYDGKVKLLAGKSSEEAIVSEGLTFVQLLGFVFSSHPKIEETYPPGTIGLLLNNKSPQTMDILQDGDTVKVTSKV